MPSPPPLPRAGSRAQKQPPSSPLPPPPGQTAAAGSGGLPGCLQLAEVAQCRFITLLRTACCGCGTEAATEALHVTYRSTNRPEEGTWQGQCSTHTAVMQKGLGPASCLMPEPGRPGQRSQPPAHGGRSGLQPVECEVCKILVSLWNKESLPGGWVTDQEPSSRAISAEPDGSGGGRKNNPTGRQRGQLSQGNQLLQVSQGTREPLFCRCFVRNVQTGYQLLCSDTVGKYRGLGCSGSFKLV